MILSLLLWFYVPRFVVRIDSFSYQKYEADVETKLSNLDLDFEKIELTTHDNFKINGYFIKAKEGRGEGTVIYIHGIRANKEAFINNSKHLSNKGYNSVIYDLRAHGESGGEHCSFGFFEKQDLMLIIDYLETNNYVSKIGVWGQSLGAAVALQTMAVDKRISFGIIESTFADLHQINHDYISRLSHISFRPLSDFLLWRGASMAGFDARKVKPAEAAKQITSPVLFVHGAKDKRIKIDYNRHNFNNIPSKDKEFLIVDNAGHVNVWEVGGASYLQKVVQFIEIQ